MRGSFFGLLLGTSKMAMLPNSCNFILFLNLCVWFSSIRKYSPASGAVGSAAACDATAIEIAESQLTAENKGLEALLLATLVIVVVNVSVVCTIAVAVAVIVTVMMLVPFLLLLLLL